MTGQVWVDELTIDNPAFEGQWAKILAQEFATEYMQDLRNFLAQEDRHGKVILPHHDHLFAAFALTPFESVRVVILGQDPYHGLGQAHGLCFSVNPGVKLPPSLKNIFKELQADLGITPPQQGCLRAWAQQGVFLLNTVLTVEVGHPRAHAHKGWEVFTDSVIRHLNQAPQPIVFVLWGKDAQAKLNLIDQQKHKVIQSAHPSPFSAHRGFLGSRPFSQINDFLKRSHRPPIDWSLSS